MQTRDILDVEYACTEKWDRIFDIKRGKSAKKTLFSMCLIFFICYSFTFFSFGDYFVNFKNIFFKFLLQISKFLGKN
jgi:hypothetical protein